MLPLLFGLLCLFKNMIKDFELSFGVKKNNNKHDLSINSFFEQYNITLLHSVFKVEVDVMNPKTSGENFPPILQR